MVAKKSEMPWQARQGDVFLMAAPANAKTKAHVEVPRVGGAVVLATSVATGHTHAVRSKGAKLFAAPGETDRLLFCETDAKLEHKEHGTVGLPRGAYLVRRQLEWSDEEMREVQD